MRNNSLDSAKICAAFCIVVVHSGTFPELGYYLGGLFENLTRWALPFFFLSSGYMLGTSKDINIMRKVNKLLSILFWVSLIYLPLVVVSNKLSGNNILPALFNLKMLFNGAFFHLWFIISLILGLMLVGFVINNNKLVLGIFFSVMIMLSCWGFDVYKSLGVSVPEFEFFRMLLGFALVLVGYTMSIYKEKILICRRASLVMILLGLLLVIFESLVLNFFLRSQIHERQFPFGCIIISIGVLLYCVNTKSSKSVFSICGERYSLGVYLLHPFIMTFLNFAFKKMGYTISTPRLFISFFFALLIIYICDKKISYIYNKINGVGVN